MKKFDFTIKGNKYEVQIKNIEGNIAEIDVNGTSYEVDIHREVKQTKTPTLVRKPLVSKPGEGKIESKETTTAYKVKAPLPGSIFKLNVAVGDAVKKGDTLLVMEAMKMENNILAEKGGVVKSIKVAVSDAVLQEDLLMEIE